jgi:hypothetical protein
VPFVSGVTASPLASLVRIPGTASPSAPTPVAPRETAPPPSPKPQQPSHFSTARRLWSVAMVYLDMGTDVALAVELFRGGNSSWGSLAVLFFLLNPFGSAILHAIRRQHAAAARSLLLLEPLYALQLHLSGRVAESELVMSAAQRNEAFLEAIPELILQFYLVLYQYSNANQWTISVSLALSLASSLSNASKAVATYRWENILGTGLAVVLRPAELLIVWMWALGELGFRVLAFTLFALTYKAWVVLPLLCLFVAKALLVCRDVVRCVARTLSLSVSLSLLICMLPICRRQTGA